MLVSVPTIGLARWITLGALDDVCGLYFVCQPCEVTVNEKGDGLDNDCDGLVDEELCEDSIPEGPSLTSYTLCLSVCLSKVCP